MTISYKRAALVNRPVHGLTRAFFTGCPSDAPMDAVTVSLLMESCRLCPVSQQERSQMRGMPGISRQSRTQRRAVRCHKQDGPIPGGQGRRNVLPRQIAAHAEDPGKTYRRFFCTLQFIIYYQGIHQYRILYMKLNIISNNIVTEIPPFEKMISSLHHIRHQPVQLRAGFSAIPVQTCYNKDRQRELIR